MSDWNFGGVYADTAGKLQAQEQSRQLFPVQLAHEAATTRLNNANAQLVEQRATSEKNMASLMQGMELGDGTATSANIMKLAGVAMKSGDPTTARELLMRASQAHAQESREAQYKAQQQRYLAETQMKKADRYGQLMRGVKNQQELDAANFIYQAEFGETPALIDYDPAVVARVQQGATKLRDQIYADHTATMEELAKQRLRNTQGYRAASLGIRQADLERKIEKDRTSKKEGGKDVGSPTKSEIDQAKNILGQDGKLQGLDSASQRTASFDLASRARALRKANPGLDAGEAMTRALTEQVQEGYYTTKKATGFFDKLLGRQKAAYGRPGASAGNPLTVPQDRSTMKSGTYYTTPKGTLLYLGGGKWQVPEAASRGGAGAPPEDDEDEEE